MKSLLEYGSGQGLAPTGVGKQLWRVPLVLQVPFFSPPLLVSVLLQQRHSRYLRYQDIHEHWRDHWEKLPVAQVRNREYRCPQPQYYFSHVVGVPGNRPQPHIYEPPFILRFRVEVRFLIIRDALNDEPEQPDAEAYQGDHVNCPQSIFGYRFAQNDDQGAGSEDSPEALEKPGHEKVKRVLLHLIETRVEAFLQHSFEEIDAQSERPDPDHSSGYALYEVDVAIGGQCDDHGREISEATCEVIKHFAFADRWRHKHDDLHGKAVGVEQPNQRNSEQLPRFQTCGVRQSCHQTRHQNHSHYFLDHY